MSRAISVLHAKSAWKELAVSLSVLILRCQAPANGSQISGTHPAKPATELNAFCFSPVNGRQAEEASGFLLPNGFV